MPALIPLIPLTFLVALIYSSVGHGGASGYLALLAFFALSHQQMATSALCLNLLVSALASFAFWKGGHFSWRISWPFMMTSIPMAFIGGLMKVPTSAYSFLLIGVLLVAAFRLLRDIKVSESTCQTRFSLASAAAIGAGIGMLSGIVGIGGGIFLSPLLLLLHWANPKQTAATSAVFIFVNSLAGLVGRLVRNNFEMGITLMYFWMVAAALLGGILGSRLGANHLPSIWLRRILAAVLLFATFKLFHSL